MRPRQRRFALCNALRRISVRLGAKVKAATKAAAPTEPSTETPHERERRDEENKIKSLVRQFAVDYVKRDSAIMVETYRLDPKTVAGIMVWRSGVDYKTAPTPVISVTKSELDSARTAADVDFTIQIKYKPRGTAQPTQSTPPLPYRARLERTTLEWKIMWVKPSDT